MLTKQCSLLMTPEIIYELGTIASTADVTQELSLAYQFVTPLPIRDFIRKHYFAGASWILRIQSFRALFMMLICHYTMCEKSRMEM